VEQFRDRLRLFAARRLRDWSAAEDVAQEALKRTLEALRGGRILNREALPGFVFQTALHICQHHARSAGREGRALRRFASDGRAAAAPDSPNPLQALLSSERQAEVREALDRLEVDDRRILSLSYVEGLETAEIARRLRMTDGNVRVRRHRALNRLAELLGVTRGAPRGLKGRA
jgi:RNA polymerase sigma-70 factor (ECF subfamily)